mmetsp:Transcript_3588/g.10580  ORF Transcript_3588/g.10580 Transcript_3588/m.10580 type:complete len:191 (+) Transcript_3588:2077-2649(+)
MLSTEALCMGAILGRLGTPHVHRVFLEDESQFQASYLSSFLGAIPPEYRLCIPSENSRAVYLGGDATPTMLYGFNMTSFRAFHIPWTSARQVALEEALKDSGVPPSEMKETIIAVQELLWAVVAFAESCDSGARRALHIAAIDNTNEVAWVRKRNPKNLYAAFIIRVLSRLEHATKNELWAVWVDRGSCT